MNQDLHTGLTHLQKFSLTPREKNSLRENIIAYAEANPILESSYRVNARTPYGTLLGVASLFGRAPVYVSLILLIVIIAGGSMVLAAEKALPGERLYPLKVGLNEPVQLAFAISSKAKAVVQAKLAGRRLAEAEGLALENRLDMSNSREIQERLTEHLNSFATLRKEFPAPADDHESRKADIELEAQVNAHSRILRTIKNHAEGEDQKQLQNIENSLRALVTPSVQAAVIENTSPSSTSGDRTGSVIPIPQPQKITPADLKKQQTTTEIIIKRTEFNLNEAQNKQPDEKAESLQRQILNEAQTLIDNAERDLQASKDHGNSGDIDRAHESLMSSNRATEEANISVESSVELGKSRGKSNNKNSQ